MLREPCRKKILPKLKITYNKNQLNMGDVVICCGYRIDGNSSRYVLFFFSLDIRHHDRAEGLREINWILTKKMQTENCYKRCALLEGDHSFTCQSTPSPFSKFLEQLDSDDKRNAIKKIQHRPK